MIIYVDNKLVNGKDYESLVRKYPNVDFVCDHNEARNAEVLIPFNPNLVHDIEIEKYPKLKWIQYFSAGFDDVDMEQLFNKGVMFSNAKDVYSKAIAEDVITKILYFNRSVRHNVESMQKKLWSAGNCYKELTGSTVLILGVGSIGKELAKRLKAFEVNVIGYRKSFKDEKNFDKIITSDSDLDTAITHADYIILALPLNSETFHFIDKTKLKLMNKEALLINVARGAVIKQDDLYEVLKNREIRGAGLDVFNLEPLPKNSKFWDLDNVFITPHNASSSNLMMKNLSSLIIQNIDLYLNGKEVRNRVI